MSDFIDYLHEVFRLFGPIQTRRMFGGYGVYHQGLMFALVADDTLYLKTDEHNIGMFETAGLGPFEYEKEGRVMKMTYYQAPEEMLEDASVAKDWALQAYAAALRAHSKRPGSGRKKSAKKKAGKKAGFIAGQ